MDYLDVEDERSILPEVTLWRRHGTSTPPHLATRRLLAQATARQHHEDDSRTASALRAAAAQTALWQHLSRLTGARVTVQTGSYRIDGQLTGSFTDFLTLDCDAGWTNLIRLGADVTVATTPETTLAQAATAVRGRTYRFQVAALDLGRRREPVHVLLSGGGSVTGTIDQVGSNYLELAEHAFTEPRRPPAVTARRLLAFTVVTMIRFQRRGSVAETGHGGSRG